MTMVTVVSWPRPICWLMATLALATCAGEGGSGRAPPPHDSEEDPSPSQGGGGSSPDPGRGEAGNVNQGGGAGEAGGAGRGGAGRGGAGTGGGGRNEDAGKARDGGQTPDAGKGGGAGVDGGSKSFGGMVCTGATPSFSKDIAPIFQGCGAGGGCHGGSPWTHAKLVNAPAVRDTCASWILVTPGDLQKSYLLHKVLGQDMCAGTNKMPPGGQVTTPNIQKIVDWICAGARDD